MHEFFADTCEYFKAWPDNDIDRVKFFLKPIDTAVGKQFIEFMPKQYEVKLKKSEEKALAARNKGNSLYKEQNYMEALKAYNESLCWAPIGSDILGYVYANRSAIYMNSGFYKICLENIEWALENSYPERLKPKLIKRQEECLEKMKNEVDSAEIYDYADLTKLSYPANRKIPFMIEGLELKCNEKYGNHLVTNQDLNVGDIVMIEKPFMKSHQSEETIYFQCFNCCMGSFLNLKPCPLSTKVMFCSEQCRGDAWKETYQYECPIIDGIFDKDIALPCHILLKMYTFFGDWTKLEELLGLAEKEPITIFDVNFNEADEITKYQIILSRFKVNQPKGRTYLRACWVYYMLKKFTNFQKIVLKTQKLENIFIKMCLRATMMADRHLFKGITQYWMDDKIIQKNYAKGLFFVCNFLSHSCIPNVLKIPLHGQSYLVVTQPIKIGERLSSNYYGACVEKMNLKERKAVLEHFNFNCDCEACTFESHDTLKPITDPNEAFTKLFPNLQHFFQQTIDPLCRFDEEFLSLSNEAHLKISEYLTENKLQMSREYIEVRAAFCFTSSVKIASKTLKSMLAPKNA